MASTPDRLNRFHQPARVQEYHSWFDSDGRLVKEALMRQCLFEGEYPFHDPKFLAQCCDEPSMTVYPHFITSKSTNHVWLS